MGDGQLAERQRAHRALILGAWDHLLTKIADMEDSGCLDPETGLRIDAECSAFEGKLRGLLPGAN